MRHSIHIFQTINSLSFKGQKMSANNKMGNGGPIAPWPKIVLFCFFSGHREKRRRTNIVGKC